MPNVPEDLIGYAAIRYRLKEGTLPPWKLRYRSKVMTVDPAPRLIISVDASNAGLSYAKAGIGSLPHSANGSTRISRMERWGRFSKTSGPVTTGHGCIIRADIRRRHCPLLSTTAREKRHRRYRPGRSRGNYSRAGTCLAVSARSVSDEQNMSGRARAACEIIVRRFTRAVWRQWMATSRSTNYRVRFDPPPGSSRSRRRSVG